MSSDSMEGLILLERLRLKLLILIALTEFCAKMMGVWLHILYRKTIKGVLSTSPAAITNSGGRTYLK